MLIQSAKDRGLDNVIFMATQPKENMPDVWSLCDVALVHLKDSPAFADVIPSKIFEAMAMGLPILLSAPKGEASDIIERHQAGIWVPAEKPVELAQAVCKLNTDQDAARRYRECALAAAPQHSRIKQADEMLTVFREVLK